MKLILSFVLVHICQGLGNEYVLQSKKTPDDLNYMPSLANGHLGFTVYGDSIYMNGIYNGFAGDSRRARIPNWLNISLESVSFHNLLEQSSTKLFEMHLKDGYFQTTEYFNKTGIRVTQKYYAHRYFDRALIYELNVERLSNDRMEQIDLYLTQKPGEESSAFDFTNPQPCTTSTNLTYIKGVTKAVEHDLFQKEKRTIYVVFSERFKSSMKTLRLKSNQMSLYYKYFITIDERLNTAVNEMDDVLSIDEDMKRYNFYHEPNTELLKKHVEEWNSFWNNFNISVSGNLELSQTINAGIFYMACSLPSRYYNQYKTKYYGLSPTGLGRGHLDDDYEGHNFWDTEIWMFPVITQLGSYWAEELLEYRFRHLDAARYNANKTGYKGARFPWESAFTGTEVINSCCPEIAEQEIHISADILFAIQQYYAITDSEYLLCTRAFETVKEIANFFVSRVEFSQDDNKYNIKNVMGPDEDHGNVTNNVYTNVIVKMGLEFASFGQHHCGNNSITETWEKIAKNLNILYDEKLDYHPQHLGYQYNDTIKQADAILLGYPLQWPMNESTRLNDLNIYERVIRSTGPAMSWSMFTINYLDVNESNKSAFYFHKTYKDFAHPEFKVWIETKVGLKGSANFLTGIGGFLQAVIHGYAGVRFQFNSNGSFMEIRKSKLPPNTEAMAINGITFYNIDFQLDIVKYGTNILKCLPFSCIYLQLIKGAQVFDMQAGFEISFDENESIRIQKKTEAS